MCVTKYSYQVEKFSGARRALMLPHPGGEDTSIAHAFLACHHGLAELDRSGLDADARTWVARLEEFMDSTDLPDPDEIGTFRVKARLMTTDEKHELSRIVDELAHWFRRHN